MAKATNKGAKPGHQLVIEDAELIMAFRNFSGREGKYNAEGDRNFSVYVDPEIADKLVNDGWTVRMSKPRNEDEEPRPFIQVRVSYRHRPPLIVMITSQGRTHLDEDTVGTLDWADIQTVDMIINGSTWTNNGKSGIKGYLKSMYVTIEEDVLERKYALPQEDQNFEDGF